MPPSSAAWSSPGERLLPPRLCLVPPERRPAAAAVSGAARARLRSAAFPRLGGLASGGAPMVNPLPHVAGSPWALPVGHALPRRFPTPPQVILGPLSTITDPYLNLFRGIIPPLGGTIDLSPILAFVVLDVSAAPPIDRVVALPTSSCAPASAHLPPCPGWRPPAAVHQLSGRAAGGDRARRPDEARRARRPPGRRRGQGRVAPPLRGHRRAPPPPGAVQPVNSAPPSLLGGGAAERRARLCGGRRPGGKRSVGGSPATTH